MVLIARNGFSLIEILVSLFVLASGALGALALHMAALQTAQQSALQTHALHLATELAERIGGNRIAVAGGMAEGNLSGSGDAQTEIAAWQQRVESELPGGRGYICHDAAPWDVSMQRLRWECTSGAAPLVIKIGWQDKGLSNAESGDSPRLALTVHSAAY